MTYNYTLLTQNIYEVGNPVHGLEQEQISGGLNQLMRSQPSSRHNLISNDNTYINKRYKKKHLHRFTRTQKDCMLSY
jgi:hypothetical protein